MSRANHALLVHTHTGVSLEPLRCTNYLPGGLSLTQTDKSREMLCMCREQGSSEGTLYVGLRNGVVQEFDCRERRFTVECDTTTGVGTLVGVAKHNRHVESLIDVPTSRIPSLQCSNHLYRQRGSVFLACRGGEGDTAMILTCVVFHCRRIV